MSGPNRNVLKASRDMIGHLRAIRRGNEGAAQKASRDAIVTSDLMNYSYGVADTERGSWFRLDRLVTQVAIASRTPEDGGA